MNRFAHVFLVTVLLASVLAAPAAALAHLYIPTEAEPYLTVQSLGTMQLSVDAGHRVYVADAFTQVHSTKPSSFIFSSPSYLTVDTVLIAESTYDVYVFDASRAYPYVKVVDGNDLTGTDRLKGLKFWTDASTYQSVFIKKFGALVTPTPITGQDDLRYCVNVYYTKQGEYCEFGCVNGFCRVDPATLATPTATASPTPVTVLREPPAPTLLVQLPPATGSTATLTLHVPAPGEWRTLVTVGGNVTAYFATIESTRNDTFRGIAGTRSFQTAQALVQVSDALETDAPKAGTAYLTHVDANGLPVTTTAVQSTAMLSSDASLGLVAFVYEGKPGAQPFSQSAIIKAQSQNAQATNAATVQPTQKPAMPTLPPITSAMPATTQTPSTTPTQTAAGQDNVPLIALIAVVLLAGVAWALTRQPPTAQPARRKR